MEEAGIHHNAVNPIGGHGLSWRAILLAWFAAHLIVDFTMMVILSHWLGSKQQAADFSKTDLGAALNIAPNALRAIGGGYFAARMAKKSPLVNAGSVGFLDAVISIFIWGKYPVWVNIVSLISPVPLATLGGYIMQRTIGRSET